jgi:hypothetical protein
MPLYWLVYRHNNSISVVIEPGAFMRAKIRGGISGFNKTEIDLMCPEMAGWEA